MKRAFIVCAALAAGLSPLRAPEDVTIEIRYEQSPQQQTCTYRLTNHGQRFISAIQIAYRGTGSRGPGIFLFDGRDAPEGWTQSVDPYNVWAGEQPDTALAPGESLELHLRFTNSPKTQPADCSKVEVSASGPLTRPAHVEPAHLALTVGPLVATRAPGPGGDDQVTIRGHIAIHNAGPIDALLNLGTLYGNIEGSPERVLLILIDEAGGERQIRVVGGSRDHSGREDPMDVPLPAGATYSVAGPWASFDLPPGSYRAVARYTGANGGLLNGGMPLLRKWSGKVESAPVEVVVP